VKAENGYGTPALQNFSIYVTDLTNCPTDMISYWKLNETSGNTYSDYYNGHDGQAGTNAPIPIAGIINGGQQFDGMNDEINVAASTDFNFGANENFSIEFWMKHSGSIQDVNVIIGRDDAATQLHWWIGLTATEGKIAFYLTSKTGESYNVIGTTGLGDGNWHHITAVRDANQIKIYADGELEGSTATTYNNGFDSPTANLNIGWLNLDDGYHYDGALDEVAMYRRALDTSVVQEHYWGGLLNKGYCDKFIFGKIKMIVDGFYDANMNRLNIRDTVSIYLRNLSAPYGIVDSSKALLDSLSFEGNFEFLNVTQGYYYLEINHRNSLETWSKAGGILINDAKFFSYDFTGDSSMAYGDNMKKKGNKWCIINGDCSQEGFIDASDFLEIVNNWEATGLTMAGDTNGDKYIDASDFLQIVNNWERGAITPLSLVKKIHDDIQPTIGKEE
jgi:hypothetical protein